MDADALVRPLPGPGLVARYGDLLLVCGEGPDGERLLDVLAEVAGGGGDGSMLVRRVAALIAADFDGRFPDCAVSGPTAGGGLAVLVYGAATATVTGRDGDVSLSAVDAIASVNRMVPGPVSAIRLDVPGAGAPHPRARLDGGVVPGAGVTAAAGADAAPQEWAPAAPEPAVPPVVPKPFTMPPPPEPPMVAPVLEVPLAPPATEAPMPTAGPVPAEPAPVPALEPASETAPAPDLEPASETAPEPAPRVEMEFVAIPPPDEVAPVEVAAVQPAHAGAVPAEPLPAESLPGESVPAEPAAAEPALAEPALAEPAPAASVPGEPAPAMPGEQPGQAAPFVAVVLAPGADAAADGLTPPAPMDATVLVPGVSCPNDHFVDPTAAACPYCGASLAYQTLVVREGPRPPLGVLVLDDGSAYQLDSDYVIGREPHADPDALAGAARPLKVSDVEGVVSRRHLRVALVGWEVQVVDLGSANGTFVDLPGDPQRRQAIPHDPVVVEPGTTVTIGRRWLRYESTAAPAE